MAVVFVGVGEQGRHVVRSDSSVRASDRNCRIGLLRVRCTVNSTLPGRSACEPRCIESVLLDLIEQCGHVRDRVLPNVQCDTAVLAAFGSGKLAEQVNVVAVPQANLPADAALLRRFMWCSEPGRTFPVRRRLRDAEAMRTVAR